MAQRLIIAAGWMAAAVLAVLVGLVAISVIGDGLVAPAAEPLSEAQVAEQLASAPPPPAVPGPPPPAVSGPAPSAAATSASRTFLTRGGTVVARCDDGRPVIVTMSPAQGFQLHERHGAEGEFRGVRDDHDRVKVDARCAGGRPELSVESRDD